MLGTKTPKCTQITLYVNSKQQYQKHLFSSSSLLDTNPPKYTQITLSGVRTRHSQKRVKRVFFEDIRQQTVKRKKNIHYKISKLCILCFFSFSFLRTETLKHVLNTLYRETEQHYQKRMICVFSRLLGFGIKTPKLMIWYVYKKKKKNGKYPI